MSGPRRWSLASMTGAYRTTGHCPLSSPCPRLLFSPPPRLLPFSPPSPPLQHFSSSSDFSLSIFAPRESGTGINFLTMFREGGERIVFSFEGFLTVAFLSSRRRRLSNLMIDRSRSIETRKYKLELDF